MIEREAMLDALAHVATCEECQKWLDEVLEEDVDG